MFPSHDHPAHGNPSLHAVNQTWARRRAALVLSMGLACASGQAQTLIGWGSNTAGQAVVPADAAHAVLFSAGENHNLAVRADGTVVAWGSNGWGQTRVPPAATNVVAVSAGTAHSLALRVDGTVVAWGKAGGVTNVPASATNVVAIAAAASHSLALRLDGTVVSWGSDLSSSYAFVPESATNVVAIAVGTDRSYAIRADGVPVAWSSWSMQPIGIPSSGRQPVALAGGGGRLYALTSDGVVRAWGSTKSGIRATNVVAISAFDANLVALRADGTLLAWGSGTATNLPVNAVQVQAISMGKSHGLALVGDGRPTLFGAIRYADWASAGNPLPLAVLAAGDGPLSYEWLADGVPIEGATSRQPLIPATLGRDATEYQVVVSNARGRLVSPPAKVSVRPLHAWGRNSVRQLEMPSVLSDPLAVAAGGFHSLALQPDGSVLAWGKNTDGQATVPAAAGVDVVAVAAGADHSLALKADGTVVGWGRDWFGQASPPPDATNVVAISAGWGHSLALRADGTVVAWGNNDDGQGIDSFLATDVTAIACGAFHNLALRTDGTVVGWGLDGDAPPEATNMTTMAAGFAHSLALRVDGTVLAWGDNRYGQTNVPASATNVVAVAAGFFHSLALRRDGTVVAWGKPVHGLTDYPQRLTAIRQVTTGEDHALALMDTGFVRFGRNLDSATTFEGGNVVLSSTVQAPGDATYQWLREVEPVAGATNRCLLLPRCALSDAGGYQLVVTTSSGQVFGPPIQLRITPGPSANSSMGAWGDDRRRQCLIPSNVSDPIAIAAGGFHAMALLPDGHVVAWGKGNSGQTNVPASATNVMAIAAGSDHSLALRRDGSVVGWGRDWDGQSTPPALATDVKAIAAGWAHSVALRRDGTPVTWGNNDYGQLEVPPDATNVIAIAAGYYHTLALRADRTLVSWGWEESVPEEATGIVAIAAGWGHSLAVRADGTILAWGDNGFGQADVPAAATNVIAVSAGFFHSMALRGDGTVVAWGRNFEKVTQVPWALRHASAIAAGEGFCLALTRTGTPHIDSQILPAAGHVGGTVLFSAGAAGTQPFQFQWLRNGTELTGETNRYLNLRMLTPAHAGTYTLRVSSGVGTSESAPIPLAVRVAPRVANHPEHVVRLPHEPVCLTGAVEGEEPLTLQWLRDGVPVVEGAGVSGVQSRTLCLEDPTIAQSGYYSLTASNIHGTTEGLIAMLAVSPIVGWGSNRDGQLVIPPMAIAPVALAAGAGHNLALLADGTVSAWGDRSLGQCDVPDGLHNVVAIAAGEAHSLVLLSDGTLQAWGDDSTGQSTIPPQASNIVAMAAGGNANLALRDDGTVVTWGQGIDGVRLGPAAASNTVSVAAGAAGFLVVRSDGSLYHWGKLREAPPTLPATSGSIGNRHALALGEDGSVLAWGENSLGQVNVPGEATNAVAVAAGGNGSLALRLDGTVLAWGDATSGQTVLPEAATHIVAIARGDAHNLALRVFEELPLAVAPGESAVFEGARARFGPTVLAAPFHRYQWFHQGIPVAGATNAALILESVRWEDRGTYQVAGTWPFATVMSAPANLAVRRFAFAVDGQLATTDVVERAGPATVSIQIPFAGGRAMFTTDGTDPTIGGRDYDGPFVMPRSAMLRATLFNANGTESLRAETLTLLVAGDAILTTSTPGGGSVVTDPSGSFVPRGTVVTLTAQPAPGWTFLYWTGDADGDNPILRLTLNRSKSVQAIFGTTVLVENSGDGSVRLTPNLPLYPFGSRVQMTAVPGTGSFLTRWEGALGGNRGSASLAIVAAGLTVRAVFESLPAGWFALETGTEGQGVLLVSPSANRYEAGRAVTLTPVPAPGQQFLGWAGDASGSGTYYPLPVVMDRSKSVQARFSRNVTLQLTTTPDRLGPEGLRFEVAGLAGDIYEVQHNGTLGTWPAMGVLTNWSGKATFSHPSPTPPAGFYRVRVLP